VDDYEPDTVDRTSGFISGGVAELGLSFVWFCALRSSWSSSAGRDRNAHDWPTLKISQTSKLIFRKTEEIVMKKLMLLLVLLIGVSQSGCAFLGGAAVGALGTGAGYEINAHSKMNQLEDDYKAERISRSEYLARKSQLEKGSILY